MKWAKGQIPVSYHQLILFSPIWKCKDMYNTVLYIHISLFKRLWSQAVIKVLIGFCVNGKKKKSRQRCRYIKTSCAVRLDPVLMFS